MALALSAHSFDGREENEVSKIFIRIISSIGLTGSGTISIRTERLQISDAPGKQNESISLAHFNAQFRIKEIFRLLLAKKLRTHCNSTNFNCSART